MDGPSNCAVNRDIWFPTTDMLNRLDSPLMGERIECGFPSPAEGYVESKLSLDDFLVPHPSATFFVQVSGDSMINAGILEGDYLIVDKSVNPRHNLIVVAALNGEMLVKRLFRDGDRVELHPENEAHRPIKITRETELCIWGVVRGVFRKTL